MSTYLVFTAAAAISQAPVGDPFAIAEITAGRQRYPNSAPQTGQGFIVVWDSEGVDGDGTGIRGRRFAADGEPLSAEFAINGETVGNQWAGQVGTDESGSFVVVWNGPDQGGEGVFARLFEADGTAKSPEFQINVHKPLVRPVPAVSRNALGLFVVAWHDSTEVRAAVFDAAGSSVVPELVVNSSGEHPVDGGIDAGILSDGGFVVVWTGEHEVAGWPTTDIFQQLFAPDGTPLGSELQLSDSGPSGSNFSTQPEVAVAETDDFFVVWYTDLNLEWGSVFGRRTQTGGAVGPILELGRASLGHEFSMVPGGEFVVVWAVYECCFRGARFDPAGNRIATFPIPDTEGWVTDLVHPGVDATEFIEIRSVGETIDADLIGQRFSTNVFMDGFESGDTSAWSTSTGEIP